MDFQTVFNDFLTTLLVGILGIVAAFLIKLAGKGFEWLAAKLQLVKNETARKELQAALNILQSSVTTTVTMLQQTIADDIRESLQNGDGKYTRDDLLRLKDQAINIVLSQTEDSVLEIIGTVYSDLTGLVGDMVETQVYNLKSGIETPPLYLE